VRIFLRKVRQCIAKSPRFRRHISFTRNRRGDDGGALFYPDPQQLKEHLVLIGET